MNQNVDFLGICQLLKALLRYGFSEREIKIIACRIAIEIDADITIFS